MILRDVLKDGCIGRWTLQLLVNVILNAVSDW